MSNDNADIIFDKARMQYLFVDGDKTYAVSKEFATQYPQAVGKLLSKMMKKGRCNGSEKPSNLERSE